MTPRPDCVNMPAHSKNPSQASEQPSSSELDILLVEDDEAVRKSLELILKQAGRVVTTASSGREALAILAKSKFRWMISDILMPDIEGLELIQTVRGRHPDMKIVAISGGGRSSPAVYLKMAKMLGADSTLEKPFGAEEFIAAVTSAKS